MPPGQVFLNYVREDRDHAVRLRRELVRAGVNVWFDEESVLPGEEWAAAISRAIPNSRYFIALLSSRSVTKRGFAQKELRQGFEELDKRPANEIYLIPVRLDDCSPAHERLRSVQYVDLFRGWKRGVERLLSLFAPERIADEGARPRLQADGLYFVRTHDEYRYHYLRFLTRGTVLAVPSNLTPRQDGPVYEAREPLFSGWEVFGPRIQGAH